MTTKSRKNVSTWKIVSPTHIFSALSIFIENTCFRLSCLPSLHLDFFGGKGRRVKNLKIRGKRDESLELLFDLLGLKGSVW